MNLPEFDIMITKLAGVAGAFMSLTFIKGSWSERIVMAAGGAVVSLYATPWVALRTGLPEGLTGFLLGLFGMAICAKVWEVIQSTPIADLWKSATDAISKKL
jgi:hypothetical protein